MSEEKQKTLYDQNEEPQPINLETMELGNLLFGHSRGNYSVPRKYEEYFGEMLEQLGFDRYGYPQFTEARTFQNEVFAVRPYYWGDDDNEAELPNFEYYPMHFKLHWYKYPLRDSYSNLPVTKEMLEKIFEGCKKSLKKDILGEESDTTESIQVLEELIHEHFSNPPLTFEELKEDMWVWDSKECEYIFIDRLWISDSNKKMMIYKGLGSQVKGEFIEERFYRKEVHK